MATEVMPRARRTLSNQGLYHVYNRAELGQPIFDSDGAKAVFLETVHKVSESLGWELHAYAIMTNHFHLSLTTPLADIEIGMHAILSAFANKHRAFRGTIGHVFQSRYRADHYPLGQLAGEKVDYVHYNPVAAGIVSLDELRHYPWSSYRLMWQPALRERLTIGPMLGALYGLKDDPDGWRAYEERLRLRMASAERGLTDEELFGLAKKTKAGALAEGVAFPARVGMTSERHREARAIELERILGEAIAAAGLRPEELAGLGKSDAAKVAIAQAIQARTLASSAWLAKALHMGSASNVRKLLRGAKGSGRY